MDLPDEIAQDALLYDVDVDNEEEAGPVVTEEEDPIPDVLPDTPEIGNSEEDVV